ncbi:MAG TPA: DUF3499 domain-containing protein [Phycicoccus sp.]|nr:DUF3499 domain-containing protein [Phycicoccus sp.]HQK31487.1 DUF3499 domain-containing protein [Phycicoccus sp.]HQV91886.1 DUF3499 domain-containing protein [Phycicoccus sp.]HRA45911.1 DUF3499 domain-containing protein [Phycicoccus sp.]
MSSPRRCTKTACRQPAVATLTYAYSDRAVVVGPLATFAEPHTYDLCAQHAGRLTPPRGWDIVRHSQDGYVLVTDTDDLLAVVDAVRETPRRTNVVPPSSSQAPGVIRADALAIGRVRGHLRVLDGDGDARI